MPEAPIALIVITWNSERTIRRCLDSLAQQTPTAYPVLVIDNASVDGTVAEIEGADLAVHVLRNPRNVGFARAANQGIAVTRAPLVAILNPDLVLAPDAVANAIAALGRGLNVDALAPWLFRETTDLSAPVPHGTVDSSGLAVTRGRRVVDRDAGSPATERAAGPVFGPSGAFAVYRRSALESVRFRNEYFDEDFFAYKEDADLAWRLARRGFQTHFDPSVRALHPRGLASINGTVPRHRRRLLPLEQLSYRNHFLMLGKNESVASLFRDLPWILVEEGSKFAYHLVRRPRVLGALRDLPRLLPRMRTKRHRGATDVDPAALARTWFRYRP